MIAKQKFEAIMMSDAKHNGHDLGEFEIAIFI